METAVLFLELGFVILGLAVLARLAGLVGFSPIPLYLLAGLAFGEGGLFPLVTAEGFIEIGAGIGVVLLLFMLGLEYTSDELVGTLRTGAPSGLLDLALNFGAGLALGLVFGLSPLAALFLGGIAYISSSGVAAKLIEDLGWVGNREIPSILSLLVLQDLAMAIYLPVIAVLARGQDALTAGLGVAAAVAAAVAILILALRYGATLSRLVFSRSDEAILLSIFGALLIVAGVTERLQISAAVGAFLVGIAVSGPAADRARVLLTPLRDLFGAVFFVFFGLQVDPSTIPPVAGPVLLLSAATLPTKLLTGWWAAGRDGVGVRGRLRAGGALVARGEFSIAIAALAVSTGVEARLGPIAAGYVLLMAVLGPVLARAADPLAGAIRGVRGRSADGSPPA
ncbi:MAG: cation:proton antiporter [Actinomycetota bacterium]